MVSISELVALFASQYLSAILVLRDRVHVLVFKVICIIVIADVQCTVLCITAYIAMADMVQCTVLCTDCHGRHGAMQRSVHRFPWQTWCSASFCAQISMADILQCVVLCTYLNFGCWCNAPFCAQIAVADVAQYTILGIDCHGGRGAVHRSVHRLPWRTWCNAPFCAQIAVADVVQCAEGADVLVFVLPHQFMTRICKQLEGKVKPTAIGVTLVKV